MKKLFLALLLFVFCGASHADETLLQRAKNLYYVNDYESAKVLFVRELEANPGNGEALDFLGWCYRYLGDLDSAVTSFMKAQDVLAGEAAAWVKVGLGETYLCAKDYDLSSKNFNEAVSLAPENEELVLRSLKGLVLAYAGIGNEPSFSEFSQKLKEKSEEEWKNIDDTAQELLLLAKAQATPVVSVDIPPVVEVPTVKPEPGKDMSKILDSLLLGMPIEKTLSALDEKGIKVEKEEYDGLFGEIYYSLKYENNDLPEFVLSNSEQISHQLVEYDAKAMKLDIVCVYKNRADSFSLAKDLCAEVMTSLSKSYGEPALWEKSSLREEYEWRISDSLTVWLYLNIGLDGSVILNIQYVDVPTFTSLMNGMSK